jgi:hypothetical protein
MKKKTNQLKKVKKWLWFGWATHGYSS